VLTNHYLRRLCKLHRGESHTGCQFNTTAELLLGGQLCNLCDFGRNIREENAGGGCIDAAPLADAF
jgi:hypothetical protein